MRRRAWAGLVAGGITAATDIAYIIIILRQGDSSPVVPVVFLGLAVLATAAVIGWVSSPGPTATALFALATPLLFVLGVLGIFSIGLPLLVASMFALAGLVQSRRTTSTLRPTTAIVGGLSALAVVVAVVALVAIIGGGQRTTVSCNGSARAPGMPRVVRPGAHASAAARPHPCRTVTSP